MEFEQLLLWRQSTRKFEDRQIPDEDVEKLLAAANRAPVGSSLYKDIHITVVRNKEKLLYLCEAAWKRFSSKEKVREIAGDTADGPYQKRPNLF